MKRMVKGSLFLDYVRMIKSRKDVDWSRYLTEEDLHIVDRRIERDEWYPLETFERMGLGVLEEIAGGDMQAVYLWGKDFMVDLFRIHESLIAEGDPMESLMRFRVLQRSFFNFDGIRVVDLTGESALLSVYYHMRPLAEEASSHQTLGFFERLLDRAGARDLRSGFKARSWEGDDTTLIEFLWKV
jgi:hypothetical protein